MDPGVGLEPPGQADGKARRQGDGAANRHRRGGQGGDDHGRDEAPDQVRPGEAQGAQRPYGLGHRVHRAGQGLADEDHAREHHRGGEQQKGGALEVGAVGDALAVLGQVANGYVGQVHDRGCLAVEAGDVRAGLEAHDQVGRPRHLWVAGEEAAAGKEAGLVGREDLVHGGIADPDDPGPHRGAARHWRGAEEGVEVGCRDERHPLAHVQVELARRPPVDDHLVVPPGVGEPAVEEQRPAQRAVEVGVGRRQRAELMLLDPDRRERERPRVDDLGELEHGRVVGVEEPHLGAEHDGVGRGGGCAPAAVGRGRAAEPGHGRQGQAGGDAGDDAQGDEGAPPPPQLAPRPQAHRRTRHGQIVRLRAVPAEPGGHPDTWAWSHHHGGGANAPECPDRPDGR